jgi:hypothetical protein
MTATANAPCARLYFAPVGTLSSFPVNACGQLTNFANVDQRQLDPVGQIPQLIQTRHLSVLTKNLAQYARATDAGEHQQVKDAFGMTKPSSQTKRMAD